jgi:hypothetical protein
MKPGECTRALSSASDDERELERDVYEEAGAQPEEQRGPNVHCSRLATTFWFAAPSQARRVPPWLFSEVMRDLDLGALAFRDVVLRFADGREEHQQDVLVTGDPFDHDGRWWTPQHWRRLHGIDEVDGQLLTWLVCAERS